MKDRIRPFHRANRFTKYKAAQTTWTNHYSYLSKINFADKSSVGTKFDEQPCQQIK